MRRFGLWIVAGGLFALPALRGGDRPGGVKGGGGLTDPDGDCKVKGRKATLAMSLPGAAHDFAGELKRWNAPRVMSKVDGDFIAEVRVSGEFRPAAESTIPGRLAYNGAGILLVKDKDN